MVGPTKPKTPETPNLHRVQGKAIVRHSRPPKTPIRLAGRVPRECVEVVTKQKSPPTAPPPKSSSTGECNVNDKTPKPTTSSLTSPSVGEDDMEWEPTESEVIDTLHRIRRSFCCSATPELELVRPQSPKKGGATSSVAHVHVVVDTNIFLSHLDIVKVLVDWMVADSRVQIYVPWMVLQELDHMKTKKDNKNKLELLARRAASYILEQANRDPSPCRIQSMEEYRNCSNLMPEENADDRILQWCLHLKEDLQSPIILLSNDVIFCTKASACSIVALQSGSIMEQLPRLLGTNDSLGCAPSTSNTLSSKSASDRPASTQAPQRLPQAFLPGKPLLAVEESDAIAFLHRFEELILGPFRQMLEYELTRAFEHLWKDIVKVKPPWSLTDVFRCVEKHWIAVFDYVYPKDLKTEFKLLADQIDGMRTSRDASDAKRGDLIGTATALMRSVQRVRKQLQPVMSDAVESLRRLVPREEEPDDATVFDLFSLLWNRFIYICACLYNAAGLPHALQPKEPIGVLPQPHEAERGVRMMLPLLSDVEAVMSKFTDSVLNDPSVLEGRSRAMSECLLVAMRKLGLSSNHVKEAALSRALIKFVAKEEQRILVISGLEELRVFANMMSTLSAQMAELDGQHL